MLRDFVRRHKAGTSVTALALATASIYGFRKAQYYAADPSGEKDCTPVRHDADHPRPDIAPPRAIAPLDTVRWAQIGGTINDASCLSKTDIYGIVDIRTIEDIART